MINTAGAGPLVSAMQVHAAVRERRSLTNNEAATIASWWHGPSGHGETFSILSHRIERGVTLERLDAAICDALANVPWDEGRLGDIAALEALREWALAQVSANA